MGLILTLLKRPAPVKYVIAMLWIVGIIILSGCVYVNQLTMTPKVEKLQIDNPIPLEVGLLITEESKKKIFRSDNYPNYNFSRPLYYLEPYQLPIGEAFERAALEIFSQVFRKVHLLRSLDEAKGLSMVLDLRLEAFDLNMIHSYFGGSSRYYNASVEIKSQAKISGALIKEGKTIWQKTVDSPMDGQRQVYSVLLKNTVSEQASGSIVSALKGLAQKMMEESRSTSISITLKDCCRFGCCL